MSKKRGSRTLAFAISSNAFFLLFLLGFPFFKQYAAMEKMMRLAQTDSVLEEQIRSTYQTDDLTGWLLNHLSDSSHPRLAKLREDPAYMQMLKEWAEE